MNIGIDMDGVLTNYEEFVISYGTKFCVEEKHPINITEVNYDEAKTFKWTEQQTENFWNKYLVRYVQKAKPREAVSEILKKLQQEGHKIYIITARNEYGLPQEYHGKMQELTIEWLKQNDIKYEKIIFEESSQKLKQCIENKIDIMIEDSPDNILSISKKIPVIKYNCQYNKKIEGENIITAYSWYHIHEIITKK